MKRSILVCLAIGLLLALGTVAMAGTMPGTGIKQTVHDLSTGGSGVPYGADPTLDRICIFCHAPHATYLPGSEAVALTYYPLWNHTISAQTSWATYTNGGSPTGSGPINISHQLQATLFDTNPGAVSKLCLSCHDGSVAVSAYGKGTPVSTVKVDNQYKIGNTASGGLKNHHPIGFDYTAVAAIDDEIAPVTNSLLGTSGLVISDLLADGKTMECSSCHDVHNTKNEGSKLTWVQDTRSALCLSCHLK